jgi:hypothetical protein
MSVFSAKSTKYSTPKLIGIGFILCVLGIGITIYPGIQFFRYMFQDAVFPITEFDANSQTSFLLPDNTTRYVLMLKVDDTSSPLPPLGITLESESVAIPTTSMNGWQSIMGQSYRTIGSFTAPESLECQVHIEAESTSDFGVFRHHKDTVNRRVAETAPWVIGGAIPFFSGVALIFFVILRKVFQSDELNLEL